MYMFQLQPYEDALFEAWNKEHSLVCKYAPTEANPFAGGAIGGRLTFSFTPNSLGVGVEVSCACGEKVNVTDYSDW